MKQKFKKRVQGAISIFLCIIFVSNYALIALLVDGGRARMAKFTAENTLDNASVSVLSYYNQMLYDLYGLFATDSLSEEQILEILNNYTKKTLGVIEIDESSVKSLIDTIGDSFDVIKPEQDKVSQFNMYDFQTDIQLLENKGSTLANTDAVESQIIDHMKYRAPYAMVDEVGGFVKKMESLSVIKERMQLTKDKLNITKSKESLFDNADAFQKNIQMFKQSVSSFASNPTGDMAIGNNLSNIATKIDEAFADVTQRMESQKPKPPQPNDNNETDDSEENKQEDYDAKVEEYNRAMEEYKNKLKNEYTQALNDVLSKLDLVSNNANMLKTNCDSLNNDFNSIVSQYKSYVDELEGRLAGNENNENYQTVYAPEIQQVKNNGGKIISDGNILGSLGDFNFKISSEVNTIRDQIKSIAQPQIDKMVEGEINSISTLALSNSTLIQSINKCNEYFSSLSIMSIDKSSESANIKKVTANGDKAKKDAEKATKVDKAESEGARSLKKEDLKIEFEKLEEPEWTQEMDTDIDVSDGAEFMEFGGAFIGKILSVLENGRDSLYINEYAISYFPNYVQHYSAKDSEIATKADNAYLIDESKYYNDYNASLAELEYILSGENNIVLNMADVSSKILLLRMVFNTAAIFTDSNKVVSAQSIAAASGPFAPMVTVGILLSWSLAESVLDTDSLLKGEEVALFKQGGSWKISVQGLASSFVGEAVEYVADGVANSLTNLTNQAAQYATQKSNEIIYNIYTGIEEQTVQKAKNQLSSWLSEVNNEIANEGGQQLPTDEILSSFDNEAEKITTFVSENSKQVIISKINNGIENVNKTLSDKITSFTDKSKEAVVKSVSKTLNKSLPIDNVTDNANNSTGLAAIKINYIDYMRILLLFEGNSHKVQRIQQLVQANLRYAGNDFYMNNSYISIASKMDASIDFFLLAMPILPDNIHKDGRLKFSVYSRVGY